MVGAYSNFCSMKQLIALVHSPGWDLGGYPPEVCSLDIYIWREREREREREHGGKFIT